MIYRPYLRFLLACYNRKPTLISPLLQEAESDAEREAMIQAAADAQQAREDADLAARDAARRRLMEDVDAIRQEQIFYKQQQR